MKNYSYLSYCREIKKDVKYVETYNVQKAGDSWNWKDVSVKDVDIFEKKQSSLHFCFSLL